MDNGTTRAEYQTSRNHNKTQPAWSYSYGTISGWKVLFYLAAEYPDSILGNDFLFMVSSVNKYSHHPTKNIARELQRFA